MIFKLPSLSEVGQLYQPLTEQWQSQNYHQVGIDEPGQQKVLEQQEF